MNDRSGIRRYVTPPANHVPPSQRQAGEAEEERRMNGIRLDTDGPTTARVVLTLGGILIVLAGAIVGLWISVGFVAGLVWRAFRVAAGMN